MTAAVETDPAVKPPVRKHRAVKVCFQTLADLDARSNAFKRATQLVASIKADLDLGDDLTSKQQTFIEHAAVLSLWAQDQATRWLAGDKSIDPRIYVELIHESRRLLSIL